MKRLKPSPALVIACIALFVALGGTATAAIVISGKNVKNYSLTGKDVKKDGLGGVTIKESRLGTVPSAESLSHSATVTAAGALVRGRGVTAAQRTADGRYLLTFDRAVQGCVAVASVVDPGTAAPPSGSATTSFIVTNGNQLQVRTTSASNGATDDRGFSVIVSC